MLILTPACGIFCSCRSLAPRVDHRDITAIRQSEHAKNIASIREIFQTKYLNWTITDASQSKWALKDAVVENAGLALVRRQEYLEKKTSMKAASASAIGLAKQSILENLGKFKTYCPVCIVDRKQLCQSEDIMNSVSEYQV